ncbi:50S ribosomal protein L20 [Candidatus Uhrbacteria bacterium RIFOXYC2_FULL_47_19]|uniref:Large ribosomal subunit protein bL20 n=1 Tax=Candidatus Uhrbacteria bacterium RIFOXYC2_FULL_47_19 TaxID=1802424 RepID=A0A1F7WFR1_9BACT|nr:MAG: 50S ribosomal protein L20 [Candidatus Uhrbacteria bacterium RIFOXYC2_FULL_47_19]HCC22143.1 50S ribosomal protein L20 [Candidatus Uhrbacteria bacterium]
MPRVKRGTIHLKRRKAILEKTKGFMWGRKSKLKLAQTAAVKAGVYAYRDRRNKKRVMRRLWQIKLNAAARLHGLSYSRLIDALKKAGVTLDRQVMSKIAAERPNTFKAIVDAVKK